MNRFKFLKCSIIIFLLLFSSHAFSQDTLRIETAIATALRNNYDILLSKQDSASFAITNQYKNAVFLPTLNANGTLLLNNNAQASKLADGTARNRSGIKSKNINSVINLNWTLFDGFRMFILRDRVDVSIRQGNLTIKNQVVNTVSEVIRTYYDIVRQKQQLKNVEEQMSFSADRLQLAQYRLDIGVGIKPEVLQAKIDYNTQKANRINQLSLIDQRKQDLNRLMAVPQTVNYEVSDTIITNENLVLGQLLNAIENVSPQLQLSKINIEVARVAVREAKALRYPTISLISAYNFSRNSSNFVVNPAFQPLFTLNRGWNYGFTASIPILNRFTVKQQIRQAELTVNYSQLQFENQQSLVHTGILNNYRSYIAQQQIIVVSDSSVVLARENLTIERERYRLGVTTFIVLRQAEENLASAALNAITARFNLKIAETELLRLRGELVR